MFLTEQQEPERGISELQKLSGIIKEYHSDECLDYAKVQETLASITVFSIPARFSAAIASFECGFTISEITICPAYFPLIAKCIIVPT